MFAAPRLLGCVLGGISGGDLGVDFVGVGRPIPDGSAHEPQRNAGVVGDQAEQSIVSEVGLGGPGDLTARTTSHTSGPPARAARRPGRPAVQWDPAET